MLRLADFSCITRPSSHHQPGTGGPNPPKTTSYILTVVVAVVKRVVNARPARPRKTSAATSMPARCSAGRGHGFHGGQQALEPAWWSILTAARRLAGNLEAAVQVTGPDRQGAS
ncbi:hypothetical protein HYQ44_003497 [Verticillium longisporum]|nr:hypothetical protein HYQ44_003497 [Verticillium longisporum]